MKLRDFALETHESLSAKKGRSLLTILGIAIGITAVVVMVSLITGFSGWLESSMGLGSARVTTVTSSSSEHELQYADAAFLLSASDVYEDVIVSASTSYTIGGADDDASDSGDDASSTSSNGVSLQVVGADSAYFDMQAIELSSGSLYDDESTDTIVLDEAAVENIFGEGTSAVGRTLTLGGRSYRICGVAESGAASSMANVSMAYVPYEVMSENMLGVQQVDELLCLAVDGADVTDVAAQTEGMLAAHHSVEYEDGEQDVYTAYTTQSALESLENFTQTFDMIAALVSGIALLVGGIGIMNMMLTNVSERYREIGLRKSLGARPRDITMQFLCEAVVLCLTGGVAGIFAGYAGAWGLVLVLTRLSPNLEGLAPVISPALVVVVFAICAGIGIIFGYYPARRAAKLDPAETLRYQ